MLAQEFSDQGCQQFIITGSATGKVDKLNATHYCLVENFDLQKNCLTCRGPIKASSESMTHGNLYKMDKNTKVVIHVHNNKMWKRLLHKIPTTDKNAQYGTPEIAKEVERLFLETNVKDQKIFVLEGHEDGIFSFGETFQEAYDIIYRIIINDEEI
ncbi:Class II aldolase/adducin N-terminal [Pseudocohnilembus persalinus]|uniref:Class II aldolase/adducin N-terminal n=1 Tax=Pseudocohnilembus persalinus TaxID=266149 RepID=A0A0V0QAL3_PSEPJ|nr:Class II aldolase/adducin N-terminal [Pseudocohnilembus persalinus]|eukprot:KRW99183.1 Class II aldolase/adducin N-terminal [Pseudocohnilembus persalinus]